jgi:hypothetical protein
VMVWPSTLLHKLHNFIGHALMHVRVGIMYVCLCLCCFLFWRASFFGTSEAVFKSTIRGATSRSNRESLFSLPSTFIWVQKRVVVLGILWNISINVSSPPECRIRHIFTLTVLPAG